MDNLFSLGNPNNVSSAVEPKPLRLDEPEDTGVTDEKLRILENGDLQFIAEGDTGFEEKYVEMAKVSVNAPTKNVWPSYINPHMYYSGERFAKRKLGSRSRKRERELEMRNKKGISMEEVDAPMPVEEPVVQMSEDENSVPVKRSKKITSENALNVQIPKEKKKILKYKRGIEKRSSKKERIRRSGKKHHIKNFK